MSVDERLRRGLRDAAAAPRVDTGAALVEVESMNRKVSTRRGVLIAVAAAAVVLAGLVWGPGVLDSLGGADSADPASQEEDLVAVLAAYEGARNARDYDTMRSLYADDAVITGHPLDESDPPIADVDEVMALERTVPSGVQSWFIDIDVSGSDATFTQVFRLRDTCHATPGDQVTVEGGTITRYAWAESRAFACTEQQREDVEER